MQEFNYHHIFIGARRQVLPPMYNHDQIRCKSRVSQVQSCFTPSCPAPQSRRVSSSVPTQGGRHSSRTPSLAFHSACCHGNHGRSAAPSVLQWSSTPCTTSWWTTGRGGRGVATARTPVSHRSVLVVLGVNKCS